MSKILVIAGHGKNKNGSFDPGANGYISKGEHKYYVENFFPAVRKFLPDNSNVILFSDYNVYDHKNLVSLANSYGKDTIVVEMHYDAASASASGGHVIVHANYAPDNLDLKIRDVIKKHIGVRYNHKGHQGISGRANLGNCNRAANGGINYRLIELGFGTNKKDADIMVNNVEAIAKDFVEALVGKVNDKPAAVKKVSVDKPQPIKVESKSIDELAREVTQGLYGSGDDRKKALGSKYDAVQSRVNEMLGANKKVPATKSIDQLAQETIAGVHGVADTRKKVLGNQYNAVQNRVNEILGGKKTKPKEIKSVTTIAQEVIDGKFGNNPERNKKLKAAGYNADAVQKEVNRLLGGKSKPSVSFEQAVKNTLNGMYGNGDARKNKLKSLGHDPQKVQNEVNRRL